MYTDAGSVSTAAGRSLPDWDRATARYVHVAGHQFTPVTPDQLCRWCFPRSTPGHAGDTEDAGSVRSAVRRLALDSPGDMAPGEPQGDATAAGAFPPAAVSELVDATDATSRANARKAVLAAIAIRKMASTTPQASSGELDFVHKMGPLIKRGHRRHNWLQRYFVLRENKVQSRCGASSLRVCVSQRWFLRALLLARVFQEAARGA